MSRDQDHKASLLDSSQYTSAEDGMYDGAESGVLMTASSSINETGLQKQQGPQTLWQRIMQKVFKGDVKVPLFALGLLISSTGNSILFKKMTNKMTNYPYFLSQMSTFVYLPIFFGIVAWEFKFTSYITPEMTAFPKRKFLFMGLFDALSGICMLFGGIHTSGSFQALLLNAVIPFTMAMSIIFLKTKYLKTQYAGALVIMAGVAVVIVPTIVGGGSSDNSVVFNLIFLLSTLPQAFSSIYKELAFGDIDLDVNYLQAWVAAFQFVLGILLAPLNSLPFLADAYVPFTSIPATIANGGRCLAGINSIVNHTIVDADGFAHGSCWSDKNNKWGAPSDSHCDDCVGAWLPTFFYIVFNCSYNLFIVLVIKYGSAALLWIILTLRLPLVQIAFAISAINNPPDSFKATSIIGLVVIILGLILYRYSSVAGGAAPAEGAEAERDEEGVEAVSAGEAALADPGLLHEEAETRLTHATASEY